jgi:hypothetical protein
MHHPPDQRQRGFYRFLGLARFAVLACYNKYA